MWFTRRCRLAAEMARTRQSVLLPNAAWGRGGARGGGGSVTGRRGGVVQLHSALSPPCCPSQSYNQLLPRPPGWARLLVGAGGGDNQVVSMHVGGLGGDRSHLPALPRLQGWGGWGQGREGWRQCMRAAGVHLRSCACRAASPAAPMAAAGTAALAAPPVRLPRPGPLKHTAHLLLDLCNLLPLLAGRRDLGAQDDVADLRLQQGKEE